MERNSLCLTLYRLISRGLVELCHAWAGQRPDSNQTCDPRSAIHACMEQSLSWAEQQLDSGLIYCHRSTSHALVEQSLGSSLKCDPQPTFVVCLGRLPHSSQISDLRLTYHASMGQLSRSTLILGPQQTSHAYSEQPPN